jgi:N6-adenosine-specific RNA methylase IME4
MKIGHYHTHEAADVFPMMDDARANELTDSIARQGQRLPIVICDGKILDGRNRARACEALGIEPQAEHFGGDPWAFVWDLNATRRDLTADQRYQIWLRVSAKSDEYLAAKRAIEDAANRARSEAAKAQPRSEDGTRLAASQVVGQVAPLPHEPPPAPHKDRAAKAKLSKTSPDTVKRGDALRAAAPALADKVERGEITMAAAQREAKREKVVERLSSIETIEAKAIDGVFDVIVIDPPWPIKKIERDCRPNQVALDYPTMSLEELESLKIPCAEDCHVWLWTTHRFLPLAIGLLSKWGLKYVCAFVWHKPGGFQPVGLPQYNCEFALYARRGAPVFLDTRALPLCFEAPRGSHSEKPEEFYDVLRRVTGGRRLDMFNRRQIEGFEGWGKEAVDGIS